MDKGRVAGIEVGDAGVVMDDTDKLCFGDEEWWEMVVLLLVVVVVAAG